MTSLKTSFNQRKYWTNHRASTVFPYFAQSIQSIVFQDYWIWKSNIEKKMVVITVRNCDGLVVYREVIEQISNHNCHPIPSYLCDGGMIEFEIMTDENIKFPFPAIMMFVSSVDNKLVSCVHSGGRILNKNEEVARTTSVESNFYCQLDSKFTPFFHIFNGNEPIQYNELNLSTCRVELCSGYDNTVLHSMVYKPPSLPYASSVIKLNDLLEANNIHIDSDSSFYLRIHTLSCGIFPRLICGNIHKESGFPFITHSFKSYDENISDDFQETNSTDEISMFFPICCVSPLDLQIRSYPTNEPLIVRAKQELQLTKTISEFTFLTGSKDASIQIFESAGVNSIVRTYGRAPSRLNCSLNYSLPNSLHPTDIATGFKCIDYPPKHSHWGHAILSNQFETLLFIRWIELPDNKSKVCEAQLSIDIFNEMESSEFRINILRDEITAIHLSDHFNISSSSIQKSIVSWRFNTEIPTIECFWVAYNADTGAIAGEHGF
tara:strand:+ start:3234 stop:4706 length:1473 start_codon:yes stop_codon:yes gene_type:complete